jgi:sugar O-acyltransferase (sialic acid O-acetyltransferase NeuD family)
MKSKSLNILGTGGHAKVVIESAILSGFEINSLYDDDIRKVNSYFVNVPIKGPIDDKIIGNSVVAIGQNNIREQIIQRFPKGKWISVIHPSAIISEDVIIGEGTVVMAGVIIQPGSRIGNHCIINTGSCIDHDCIIEDYVHVAPNSSIAGGVYIGKGAFIGIGSCIIPQIVIGKWSIIGAGSVVISNQPDYCTSVGMPAMPIKFKNEKK